MSTQGDSPNFTTLRYVAIAILTLASMIFGYLQANYQGGMIFCFFPKNAAKKKRKRFRKIKTTLVSTYVLGVSFPTIHLRLRLPCLPVVDGWKAFSPGSSPEWAEDVNSLRARSPGMS